MRFYQLGHIANSFMAIADKFTIFNSKALKLAELFNKNIDFVKTGHLSSVPEDLFPLEYPDYMEKNPSYPSYKANGYLYRRSKFDVGFIDLCECLDCLNENINELPKWKQIIVKGSSILIRETKGINIGDINTSYMNGSGTRIEYYKSEIEDLLGKYALRNEEALFASSDEFVVSDLKKVINKYKDSIGDISNFKLPCNDAIQSYLWLGGHAYKGSIKRRTVSFGKSTFQFNSNIYLDSTSDISNGENTKDTVVQTIDSKSYNSSQTIDFSNNMNIANINLEDISLSAESFKVKIDIIKFDLLFNSLDPNRLQIFSENRFNHRFITED